MATPKVSVTVPVYNTSRYLKQCLDSLARQTLSDIEFIIVDDGSTDGSGDICDEYAAGDNRFRVIHQPNGGLSVARQTGLDAARGEYVIVCDSDDWAAPDMYEKLYQKAKETDADIAMCLHFSEYDGGKSVVSGHLFKYLTIPEFTKELLQTAAHSSWSKLYKRSLFAKSGATYEPGINLGEDALILYKLLKANPKIVQINKPLYHYRRLFGESTYTNRLRMSHIKQLLFILNWLQTNYNSTIYRDGLFQKKINLAFSCLRTSDLDANFLKKFLEEQLPSKSFLRHKFSIKNICVMGAKIFPISLYTKVFNMIYPYFYR